MTHYNELTQLIDEEIESEAVDNLADALFAEYKADFFPVPVIPPYTNTGLEVGDIWNSSWGYDQTNVDFYQVVKVTAKTVTVRKIGKETCELTGRFTGTVTPVIDSFDPRKAEMRRTVRTWSGWANPSIKINDSEYAYPWNGKPQHVSSYA
jgi:hypothetical protein